MNPETLADIVIAVGAFLYLIIILLMLMAA